MAYKAAQLSYLVALGMRPDADDQFAEEFARGLTDLELAEFERIADETQEGQGDQVQRGAGSQQGSQTNPPAGNGTQAGQQQTQPGTSGTDNIQRNESSAGTVNGDDIQRRVDEALAQRERDRQARHDFIRSQAGDDIPRDLVERAYREDWDQARVSREFLQIVRSRPAAVDGGHVGIISRSHDTHCTLQALQGGFLLRHGIALDSEMFRRSEASAMLRRDGVQGAWLHQLAGATSGGRLIARAAGSQPDPLEQFERARDEAHRYTSMSMVDFAREALRLAGRSVPDDREDMIKRAMSTATLSAIFSTSVNMMILAAYLGIEDTTRGWCYETDVADFKQVDRGRLTKASGMKKLARGAEAQPITYGDETESYKIARYAGQFTADEQDFIDDTFGGMSQHTPAELGELAAELRPNLVYAILLANANMRDSVALFHASHGNLETSSALGALTLKTAKANMVTQTENGRSIRNAMRYLLVPANLEFTALQLVNSAELRNQSTSSQDGTSNPHQGTLTVVTDPRLDNGVTDPDSGTSYGGSETTWYGAAAGGRNGIEVGYRRGTGRAPRMEQFMLTGARWGMGWKCNIDIGAKAIDWRGLHKATA